MTGRKRSSGLRAPRKRSSKKESSQADNISEHDRELAQAVCQVVKDLVSQVADEPYGDLSRKRPPFFSVLRKFVKDSVQAFEIAAAAELVERIFKRKKRRKDDFEEDEIPYGIDLVCWLIKAELEKAEKKERVRVYNSQKAAQRREKKKQEAFEAARAAEYPIWDGMFTESGSSDEDDEDKLVNSGVNPFLLDPTIDALSDYLDETMDDNVNSVPPLHYIASLSPSPRSDDSEWEVPPPSMRHLQSRQLPTTRAKQQTVMRPWEPTYSIFNRTTVAQSRGRGRGRGVHPPTVRSMLDAAMASPRMDEQPMHSHVSLRAPIHSKKMEPVFDFPGPKKVNDKEINGGPSTRGTRGKATRGRGTKTQTRRLILEMNEDAEKYQQQLMSEAIETSGESASQESLDDMSNTIDEVVKRVNGMSDEEFKLNGVRDRERVVKKKMEKKIEEKRGLKRRISQPSHDASTSRVKRSKNECEVVIIESSPSVKSDEEGPSTFRTPSPIPLILDSSEDDVQNQESIEGDDDASSNSDVVILDVPRPFFPRRSP